MANYNPMPGNEPSSVPARVYLQPVAAPSILGLYAFAGATFMVAAHMAHWFGNTSTDLFLAPFAAIFGGLAQFAAGMWSFKARDGVASAMHGTWGSFWIAYGILQLAFARGALTEPQGSFSALGYWFIVLAAITWAGTWAASVESKVVSAVLGFLAAGSTVAAIANLGGWQGGSIFAGYLFIISAVLAWYAASAMMLESAYNRPVLSLAKPAQSQHSYMPGVGEPGVIRGQ
ncbi:MAG TPA: GPR1/FUN34/YaaH family transporter [Candidatus Acidoferrales bacterium]|nr:GPR1/FUN34/YaaH family transporter [Candidatus Acidoferrales bacterium]